MPEVHDAAPVRPGAAAGLAAAARRVIFGAMTGNGDRSLFRRAHLGRLVLVYVGGSWAVLEATAPGFDAILLDVQLPGIDGLALLGAEPLEPTPLAIELGLAHDLGHTPFGHAGQDTLNACMRDYGGFEHNLQSLRVVDELEIKYADFPGLNLMFETREGILKHCSKKNARTLGDVGRRFLDRSQPGLEAQLADISDAVAYNNHDVDDGYRAGLISLEQLREQALFESQYREVTRRYPDLEDRRLIYEIIRRMINTVVTDLIETTRSNLEEAAPASIDEVRAAGDLAGHRHRARWEAAAVRGQPDDLLNGVGSRDAIDSQAVLSSCSSQSLSSTVGCSGTGSIAGSGVPPTAAVSGALSSAGA